MGREEERRDRIREFGALVEHAPVFIAFLRGPTYIFQLANRAYRDLIGARELMDRPVEAVVPEARAQGYIDLLDGVMKTREPFIGSEFPLVLERGNGPEQRYVTFLYQPVFDEPGGPSVGIFAIGMDMTDAALDKQRLRAQFHGLPTPTFVWRRVERNGRRTFILFDYNRAALRDWPKLAAHLGQTVEDYFQGEDDIHDDLAHCLETASTFSRKMVRTNAKGRRNLIVTFAPAPPELVIVHADDQTDRVRLEERLRQSQKMDAIGRLAGGVAHDFNNLLSVILSYTDLRLSGHAPADEIEADFREIQTAARRATELTSQLLAFSRQQVLQPRRIDVSQVVLSMRKMLKRMLGEDVELVIEASKDAGRAYVDRGQFEQVIMNLVVNARDAMPNGGTLTIEVRSMTVEANCTELKPGSDYVCISVQDTGSGIDAETLPRIFEPFFTTKEAGKGTGLGLATVFGIVEQSGGRTFALSEIGKGSTFNVCFPRHDGDAEESVRPPPTSQSLRGAETVLYVEDDEQLRVVGRKILRSHGYHVLDAANAGEAFLIAEQHPGTIDLLLCDVVMPRMNGPTLAKGLASRRPQMKILFVSGYTDDEVFRAGASEDRYPFLQKPFTPQRLLEKVRSVLSPIGK